MTSLCVNAKHTILLQTARAMVFNPEVPQSTMEVRIVLDSGSQRSYITGMSFHSSQQQNVHYDVWFKRRTDTVSEFVKVGMVLKSGQTQQLLLFAMPMIWNPFLASLFLRAMIISLTSIWLTIQMATHD